MFVGRIEEMINAVKSEDVFERLAEETFNQINNDDEGFHHIGRDLWNAYVEDPVATDNVLMALCGWRMKSILIFAGLIPDDEGLIL